jgi:hypothetical protein
VAFSLLARLLPTGDFGIAALVAAVIAVMAIVFDHPRWPPKIIQATSLILFAAPAVAGFVAGHNDDRWLSRWAGAGAGLVLGVVILLLIPLMPFTEQFARAVTPESAWTSPAFLKINRVLSAAWGVAIVGLGASRVVAALIERQAGRQRARPVTSASCRVSGWWYPATRERDV